MEKERVGLTDPSIILQAKQRDLKGWAGVNVYIVGTRKLLNHQSLGISLLTLIQVCETCQSFFRLEILRLFMYFG